jgi:hypothetical protein
VDLIVDAQPVTPATIAALLAIRNEGELICDRCLDPEEPVVVTMQIAAIGQTFALCGTCTRDLPKWYQEV